MHAMFMPMPTLTHPHAHALTHSLSSHTHSTVVLASLGEFVGAVVPRVSAVRLDVRRPQSAAEVRVRSLEKEEEGPEPGFPYDGRA